MYFYSTDILKFKIILITILSDIKIFIKIIIWTKYKNKQLKYLLNLNKQVKTTSIFIYWINNILEKYDFVIFTIL